MDEYLDIDQMTDDIFDQYDTKKGRKKPFAFEAEWI